MGDIFSKLLEESDNQRKQIQDQESAALSLKKSDLPISPSLSHTPLALERSTAVFSPSEALPSTSIDESKQAILQASNIASKQASLLVKIKEIGRLKATNAATFRFPPDLLEKLAEIEYELRKIHKIKTTKNMIIVGALALFLYEFEEKESESNLYQFLSRE